MKCQNNLKQLALACHNYEGVSNKLPPAFNVVVGGGGQQLHAANNIIVKGGAPGVEPDRGKYYSIWVALFPYAEQANLANSCAALSSNFTNATAQYAYSATATAGDPTKSPGSVFVPGLACPSEPLASQTMTYFSYTFGVTTYGCVSGTQDVFYGKITRPFDGVFYPNSGTTLLGIADGTSNTIFFAERTYVDGHPTARRILSGVGGWAWCGFASMQDYVLSTEMPLNYTGCADGTFCDERLGAIGSRHTNGANVSFADGSVRFLTLSGAGQLPVLQELSTRASGRAVTANY
jgi:prepilin-type processing-associated H-X9-DG protein